MEAIDKVIDDVIDNELKKEIKDISGDELDIRYIPEITTKIKENIINRISKVMDYNLSNEENIKEALENMFVFDLSLKSRYERKDIQEVFKLMHIYQDIYVRGY